MTALPDKGARERIRTDHETNLVCLAGAGPSDSSLRPEVAISNR